MSFISVMVIDERHRILAVCVVGLLRAVYYTMFLLSTWARLLWRASCVGSENPLLTLPDTYARIQSWLSHNSHR